MNRKLWTVVALGFCALALGGCTSSMRLGDMFSTRPAQAAIPSSPTQPQQLEPVEAAPAGPVTSEPLPPLEGHGGVMQGNVPPLGSSPSASQGAGTDIAALPPQTPLSGTPPLSGRSTMVGSWTAQDASGGTCRVQLSSAPALDLYKASSSNCANKDLARVSAWDFREGEVYLYQPGGAVAARLRASGGAMQGILTKSGAPLTLSK